MKTGRLFMAYALAGQLYAGDLRETIEKKPIDKDAGSVYTSMISNASGKIVSKKVYVDVKSDGQLDALCFAEAGSVTGNFIQYPCTTLLNDDGTVYAGQKGVTPIPRSGIHGRKFQEEFEKLLARYEKNRDKKTPAKENRVSPAAKVS